MDNFIFYVRQGLFHVLDWNAYDHILFLIALAVIYDFKNIKNIIWLITLFTVGHTLSLILAAYNIVEISYKWIEFLIPVTIIITALANIIFIKNTTKNTKTNINLLFALFFGLIHGFGFSSYFKLLVGTTHNKFIPLLEFALGVELAQIVIVTIVLIVGFIFQHIFRFSKRDWVLIISSIVIGIVLPILKGAIFW
ncbi:HupE / UreJ protein [Lutibacter profundi]|uniref:HupE / UreJ protein n=1 Tax=Lutibacter profundi TaxID=1622118 RepID=A0A109RNR7_9FLAO|nr:HupE/UreJ family protein [Lutibacter profundi]AMC11395.1 HupE / UreJ protein [Lutibacter profundi]